MISEMAKEDIEQLQAEGLNPTVEDIVRLNALALKFDAAKARNAGVSQYTFHRVAYLSDDVYFREPTLGHEIWLKAVRRWIDDRDFDTVMAVEGYCLSREPGELTNPDERKSVESAVREFCEICRDFSISQIYLALDYCEYGYKPTAREYPLRLPGDRDGDVEDFDEEDWNTCVGVGILNKAKALPTGLTLAELKQMTREEALRAISMSYRLHGLQFDQKAEEELGDYYSTLDIIRSRLNEEKNNKDLK